MKLKTTKGISLNLNISPSKHPIRPYDKKKSQFQYDVGVVLQELFPQYDILEEFYIPMDNVYLDFFIPKLRLVVEAHGKQHYQFIPHFHNFMHNFLNGKMRDSKKEEWCKCNRLEIVTLPYTENTLEKIKIFLGNYLKGG